MDMKEKMSAVKATRNDPMYEGVKKVIARNTPISGSVLDTVRRMAKPVSEAKMEQVKSDYRLSLLTGATKK